MKLKKKNVLVMASMVIIIILTIVSVSILNNPMRKFQTYFNNKNYGEARNIYDKKLNNAKRTNELKQYFEQNLRDVAEVFNDGKLNYTDAISKLNEIDKYNVLKTDIVSIKEKIEILNTSMTSYKEAQQLLKDNKRIEAIEQLNKVVKEDKNYSSAQQQLKDELDNLKKTLLADAENYAAKKDYAGALTSIETLLKYFANNNELKEKQNTYNQGKLNEGKEKAEAILKSKDSKAAYKFDKIINIAGKDYYGFFAEVGPDITDDALHCINIDTSELIYYKDADNYLTEAELKNQEEENKIAQEKAKTTYISPSGVTYHINSISYSELAKTSKVYLACINNSNKALRVYYQVTFYDANNKVLQAFPMPLVFELKSNTQVLHEVPLLGINKNDIDHFSIKETSIEDVSVIYNAVDSAQYR